ncbi:MAG: hypothetical protein KDC46_01520 [Thermoleophilia bacterium]|nr:hypothetical protein [Thermoleophilia bacterium]
MSDPFEQAALELYELQRATIPAYDAWCIHELAQRTDPSVDHWHQVPALPIAAFKQLDVFAADAPVAAEWHSSGTTAGAEQRSTHRLATLDAYDAAIDEGVSAALLPDVAAGERDPIACVQLQPSRADAPDSSLTYMFDRIRTGPLCRDAGAFVNASYEVDDDAAWTRLEQLAADGEPVLVLATSFALAMLIDAARANERAPIELPPASRVVDTGGYKGRTRELIRPELLARVETWLGVPEPWCENEYGMSEISSMTWLGSVADAAGHPLPGIDGTDLQRWLPSTLRARVVDPITLEQVADGAQGLLVLHDVANIHSCAAIRTEDLAVRRGDSFELLGRAPGAALKGCSLRLEDVAE